ncbi:MAG TPA: hypothetical protein VMH20_14275 [Verrucomicrobiae bacterium]|nr:hypothetical protein [Verrucomicrobiae bacterium]
MPHTEQRLIFAFVLGLAAINASGQEHSNKPSINDIELTPKEVVEQLWSMATRGDLLTQAGWIHASQFFTTPAASPGNGTVLVVSNEYGIVAVSIEGNSAKVQMAYDKVGQLDSQLRFTRATTPANIYQTAEEYHLITTHRHIAFYASDGKTKVEDRVIPESIIWQIKGATSWPPWTTVNTAIRYVLEQKAKTKDPLVRKNADETIQKLLALH